MIIDGSDKARLGRKIQRLLDIYPGKDFMHVLRDLTNIKDELISLLDLPDSRLEQYIDYALNHS